MSEKVAGSTLSLASSSRFLREVRLVCIAWWCHASARKEGVAPLGEDSSVEKIRENACTLFVYKAHVSLCEPRARYGSLRAPSAKSHQANQDPPLPRPLQRRSRETHAEQLPLRLERNRRPKNKCCATKRQPTCITIEFRLWKARTPPPKIAVAHFLRACGVAQHSDSTRKRGAIVNAHE